LFERTLSTAIATTYVYHKITLSEAYTNFTYLVFQNLTSVEANVASEVILAVNSFVILAFISLVTLVLFGFSASPASS
jgi:hypothetical protein